jgi:hypothetical protein
MSQKKNLRKVIEDVISKCSVQDENEEHENNGEEKKTIQVSKEFQENVIKFVNIDDLIKKKEDELKNLKKQKKPHEEFIIKYLSDLGEDIIDITKGHLKINKSEKKSAITKDTVENVIKKKFQDPLQIQGILKEIEDSRQTKTTMALKRVTTR